MSKLKSKSANGKAAKAPSVPHLIDAIGGPSIFGRVCGFKKNPGPRGSDMRRRKFIPVEYWPSIVAFGRSTKAPPGFFYVTWKSMVEAHVGHELPT